jgi:TrmH family RNA methyltransferase
VTITSTRNVRIKEIRKLHDAAARRRLGKTILEGPNLIEAAFSAGIEPDVVCASEGGLENDLVAGVPADRVLTVTPLVLRSVAPTENPRGPIAVIDVPSPDPLEATNTVVLWEMADPGNVGTLIRTAAALGWNVATVAGVDPWAPKVLRAAAGGHFATAISRLGPEPITELLTTGLSPTALVVSGGRSPSAGGGGKTALIVGNEAHGLDAATVAACDASISLPMQNQIESLNASVAGAIAMWALRDG